MMVFGTTTIPRMRTFWKDDDASLVMQFETAVMDTVQEEKELATFYVSYRTPVDGSWRKPGPEVFCPQSNSKGRGKGVKGKSKSLAHQIATSACRLCGQNGHWKAERPTRKASNGSGTPQIPTSFVIDLESRLHDIQGKFCLFDPFSKVFDLLSFELFARCCQC